MFDKMKKAGLSVDEVAVIVGVSRVSIFNWRAGRSKPHPQVQYKVDRLVVFLTELLDLGKLPLRGELSRDERKIRIAKLKAAFEKFAG